MWTRATDTFWLTHASFEPAAPNWRRQRWRLAGAAVGLLLLLTAGRGLIGEMFVTAGDLAEARKEQAFLAAEVERLHTRLAVEGTTRSQLEQHAAELNTQVEELSRQVQFLTARTATAPRAQ